MCRQLLLLCGAGALVSAAAACESSTGVTNECLVGPTAASAVVTMAWTSRSDSLRVLVNGAGVIGAACSYVRTQSGPGILSGRIVRGAGVDPRVPFHYLPDSVALVEVTIELCDSALLRTSAEAEAYFLGSTGRSDAPSAPYCPWGARPVRVESAP